MPSILNVLMGKCHRDSMFHVEMHLRLWSTFTCVVFNLSRDLGALASHQQRINCFSFLSFFFFFYKAFRACGRSLLPSVKPATFGFDLVSVADPFLNVQRHCNSKLTHRPPSKGEKMLWSVLQPTAHHSCRKHWESSDLAYFC